MPEELMAWESAAKQELERALKSAQWLTGKVVVLTGNLTRDGKDAEEEECESFERLCIVLAEIYSAGWDGEVPWDGGRVFEPDFDMYEAAELLKDRYSSQAAVVGWKFEL